MHKDHLPTRWKDNVGVSRKFSEMEPKTVVEFVQQGSLGARFFCGIRFADGRDILNSTIGAGPSRTEQNVSYPGRGVLAHCPTSSFC